MSRSTIRTRSGSGSGRRNRNRSRGPVPGLSLEGPGKGGHPKRCRKRRPRRESRRKSRRTFRRMSRRGFWQKAVGCMRPRPRTAPLEGDPHAGFALESRRVLSEIVL